LAALSRDYAAYIREAAGKWTQFAASVQVNAAE
jgi:hypothetical protein